MGSSAPVYTDRASSAPGIIGYSDRMLQLHHLQLDRTGSPGLAPAAVSALGGVQQQLQLDDMHHSSSAVSLSSAPASAGNGTDDAMLASTPASAGRGTDKSERVTVPPIDVAISDGNDFRCSEFTNPTKLPEELGRVRLIASSLHSQHQRSNGDARGSARFGSGFEFDSDEETASNFNFSTEGGSGSPGPARPASASQSSGIVPELPLPATEKGAASTTPSGKRPSSSRSLYRSTSRRSEGGGDGASRASRRSSGGGGSSRSILGPDVPHAGVVRHAPKPGKPHRFYVELEGRALCLQADCEADMLAWMAALGAAIRARG